MCACVICEYLINSINGALAL